MEERDRSMTGVAEIGAGERDARRDDADGDLRDGG